MKTKTKPKPDTGSAPLIPFTFIMVSGEMHEITATDKNAAMRALCAKLLRSWSELHPLIADCFAPDDDLAAYTLAGGKAPAPDAAPATAPALPPPPATSQGDPAIHPKAALLAELIASQRHTEQDISHLVTGFLRAYDHGTKHEMSQLKAELAAARETFDDLAGRHRILCASTLELQRHVNALGAALGHALTFIEHAFPFDGGTYDTFDHTTDGGPVMECNLKMMRDALKGGK